MLMTSNHATANREVLTLYCTQYILLRACISIKIYTSTTLHGPHGKLFMHLPTIHMGHHICARIPPPPSPPRTVGLQMQQQTTYMHDGASAMVLVRWC